MIPDDTGVVYRYVRSRLAPQIDRAEDVVQDVFLAACENLSAYRGQAPLESWLIGIASHKIKDYYRARQREHQSLETVTENPKVEGFTPDFVERIDTEVARKKAREVLSKLPDTYRKILMSRYWDECPVKTIARRTGKTEKAIERLLARARDQFRSVWNQQQ
jgi:RNA polymerase sigma-70 factor (ECF subfamily)